MNIQERQNQILKEFSQFQNWEDRYRHIIAIGKQSPELAGEFKKPEFLVKGCQSQVWLKSNLKPDQTIEFLGDSDAMIVKGLVTLLVRFYSGMTADEVLLTQPDFISKLGFDSNLSPSRANGLNAMIKQMKYDALVYKSLQR